MIKIFEENCINGGANLCILLDKLIGEGKAVKIAAQQVLIHEKIDENLSRLELHVVVRNFC
jgi:hypothetical protein